MRNVITLFCLMFALGAVAEPLTVKPGKGIQLTTEDEEFQLNVRPRAQFLYIFDTDFDVEPEALPDASHSLQLRRARLAMTGHMFGPRHYFKMELAFSPRDLGMKDGVPTQTPLLDLYSEFRYFRDINLRVGQYKVPFSRQRVISSGNLQMVDRTLANGEFNLDRDVGADLRSKNLFGWDLFRYYVGVYAGEGRDAFQPIEWNTDLHFMSLARAEFVPHGECDDYTESDFVEDRRRPCLSLGLAHAFLYRAQNNKGIKGSVPEDGGTTSMDVTTMDLMAKWYGLFLFTEGYFRYAARHPGGEAALEEPRTGYGFSVQAGKYFFTTDIELTSRYSRVGTVDWTVPFTDILLIRLPSSIRSANEIGVGWSYYPVKNHSLKLQGDFFYVWNDDALWHGNTQVRIQLQAAF